MSMRPLRNGLKLNMLIRHDSKILAIQALIWHIFKASNVNILESCDWSVLVYR